MKEKILSDEEFEKIINSNGELIFYKKSPLSKITEPQNIIFFALHWDQPKLMGSTGTAYACCEVANTFKFYLWSIHRSSNKEKSKILIDDIKKAKVVYHYTKNLPSVLKDQSPNWVNLKVVEIKKKMEADPTETPK